METQQQHLPPPSPQQQPETSSPVDLPTSTSAQLDASRGGTASTSNEKTPELFRYKLPKKENMFILPLVYSPAYNIYFYKLENLHPFDCHKYEKIAGFLMDFFKKSQQLDLVLISPRRPVTNLELQLVHSKEFIRQITRNKFAIIKATEAPVMTCIPMCLIRKKLIKAFKTQVAGSILTAYLSLKYKICINLGGGFHHCSSKKAGGFCLFADITLMYKYLWSYVDNQLRVMIIDVDAHQGNGHENDAYLLSSEQRKLLFILDIYNARNYPGDEKAKKQIDLKVELKPHTKDAPYLERLRIELDEAVEEFQPNLIIYNAGTDCLIGDPLGGLDLSPQGIIMRDEMVFRVAKRNNLSVAMVMSGGYQANNAQIIAESIQNLFAKGYISRINLTS